MNHTDRDAGKYLAIAVGILCPPLLVYALIVTWIDRRAWRASQRRGNGL